MEVVGHVTGEVTQSTWHAINGTSQLYVGQLVYDLGDGVDNMGQAAGEADTTGKKVPYGIVSGTSNRTPVFSSTSNSDTITGVASQAAQVARENVLVGGQFAKGDKRAFVKIDRIFPGTKIKAHLYNNALGAAPTLQTVTTGSTDGLSYTANATDVAGVADLCTAYCRTGANGSTSRVTQDTSTTVISQTTAFAYDIAVGDTFVRVPLRETGLSYVQTDANALWLDVSITPATDYWIIDVMHLDLSEASRETVIFTFHGDHFNLARA